MRSLTSSTNQKMLKYKHPERIGLLSKEQRLEVITKAMGNYHYFCEVILGYHDMNEHHEELCKFLQNHRRHFRLALMPRHTFKSCVITQGYGLWSLLRDPDLRILIYSDSAEKAQNFLLGMKQHIEGKFGNSRFREFFKGWEVNPYKEKWNESQIVISARKKHSVEPSVDTSGIESSKVGMHYDLIFFDDIVSDKNINTKGLMDKVHDCYKKSLSLLKPNGDVIMCGTRWHFNDAYGRIIKDNEEKDIFGVFVRQAIIGNEYLFGNCGPNSLTKDFLDRQRAEQGSYVFSCLYQNSPVSAEAAMYKYEDFGFYGELKKSSDPRVTGLYDNLYITGTLDPAGEGEDYTAGTVVGTDAAKRMHILELYNSQNCTPSQMIDWIIKMNMKYKFRKFGIETTFFRGMLQRDLEERLRQESQGNPFFHGFSTEELKTRWRKGEGKRMRIESMQPYHERGDILFPGKSVEGLKGNFSDLAYQMMQVTHDHIPEPNDLLDALSWQVDLVQRGGMPEQEGPPINSPAWLEKQWVNEHNRMQKRLPRRSRRTWQTSLT